MPTSDTGPVYQSNIKTTNYPKHIYTLSFTVSGDPLTHTVQFVIGYRSSDNDFEFRTDRTRVEFPTGVGLFT
jgi:hypothetical protein